LRDDIDRLLGKSYELYEKALELLSRGDYYDAAEKAWSSVEYMRKAFLVASKIPYEKEKTISQGLVLFSDILRGLDRRDILKLYDQLMLGLHILGFYEQLIPIDEIEDIIRDGVVKFLSEMKSLIKMVRGIDMSKAVEFLDKIGRVKQEIISRSLELCKIRQEYISYIEQILAQRTPQLIEYGIWILY